jgi:dipeptidyl aminopeptidase/acylaminoacyl peptidase
MKRIVLLLLFFCPLTAIGQILTKTYTKKYEIAKEMAWIPEDLVKGQVRGIVFVFQGLNSTSMRKDANAEEKQWAAAGYLVVQPYYGPWCWMNRQAREMVDFLTDAVFEQFNLNDDAPIVITGNSMGGFGAILYSLYAKRPVTAVVAICPVCDLKFHYTEREDIPRTIHCAYWGYEETFDERLRAHNPMEHVEQMPDIPYFIIHTSGDTSVSKAHHSDLFVQRMRETGHTIIYKEIEGGQHCGPIPEDIQKEKLDFILSFVK